MSSLLSIPSTQSLPEVWVTDCWLYFATTLCWSIDHCRNNLESPQHQLHLNLTDKHCRRMGGEKDGNVSWNYFCWRQLELKLRCCEMIVLVESDWERERLEVVTGAGSVISPPGPVAPLLSPPTDMNNGCSSSGQEVEGQETAEDDRRDF